tara:strand:+ start:634 stop:951 length:318 start_codon:yes stop_codon:yes gene_type:complete
MANNFKNYFGKSVAANATIFTANTGTQATIIGMTIANLTSAPITANVFLTAGGIDYYMISQATVAVGSALVPVGGDQKVVLEANDSIKVSTSGTSDVILSVLEIT